MGKSDGCQLQKPILVCRSTHNEKSKVKASSYVPVASALGWCECSDEHVLFLPSQNILIDPFVYKASAIAF